ncbi:hypothetical protein NQ315_009676 [Exocentrus adspersus]|uniref:Peptidase S1 domain-containing protein n=1 Tax=Exocentrus adspersus TaxID=1586481 RepID=A0AAV8WGE8_9CUCU|nr:hypothetical protein NQ315_009676 [Exocentrus adspersus]
MVRTFSLKKHVGTMFIFSCSCIEASAHIHSKLPKNCGLTRYHNARERIIDGDIAALGQFPYLARIGKRTYVKSKPVYKFFCGGALISKYYIATAAHCKASGNIVRLGENDVSTDRDCNRFGNCAPPVQDIEIQQFRVHRYDDDKIINDYGLIELKTPAEFNEYVQPICLPPAEMDHESCIGKWVSIAGFGRINTNPVEYADKLQYITAPIINRKVCNHVYSKYNKKLTDTQFCIGHPKEKDSCNGDSGGPAIMSMNLDGRRRDYLIGVVSYGRPVCGTSPSVYTDVSRYVNWTMEKLYFG